ncbi:hypothetical protein N0V95_009062, partial [Ascochyta clinopodiicola]
YAGSKPPSAMLTFAQYKARPRTTETSRYDTSTEKRPYHPWYALDHEKIARLLEKSCSKLLALTATRSATDTELSNLHSALERAKTVSHGKTLCVVFLGEQGTGKSSLLCSVLDRDVVDVSSSSSACTAFPTIIAHKEGADDGSVESDVVVEYLGLGEIRRCVEEQARRYRFAFPRKRGGASLEVGNTNDRTEEQDQEEEEDEEEEGNNVEEEEIDDEEEQEDDDDEEEEIDDEEEQEDDDDEEEEEGDGKEEEEEEEEETEAEKQQTLNSARTARDFFRIIFNSDQDRGRHEQLENALEYSDIESSRFADMCVGFAKERLASIGAQNGVIHHKAIQDQDLTDMREEVGKLWPLVKSLRLETGHVLLRNNLCFLDLPGYGDDNQIRTALVEKFREMANFEIVVTPAQRIVTSVTHNEYLSRSTRRLGAHNTLLIANKCDQLLDDLISEGVNKIQTTPFPEAKRCLKQFESLLRARDTDPLLLRDYRRYVLEIAGSPYIKREEQAIKRDLRKKNVEVDIILISARQYSLCREAPYGPEPPVITVEATGIPRLRQYLLNLPARMNYETLQYHVYETLPDIFSQIQRVLTKFVEDAVYAEMRKDLVTWLPVTKNSLEDAVELLVSASAVKPWDMDKAEAAILYNLGRVVRAFVHPTPYYATLLKIIKENGIPVNGKGKGRNLNKDILDTMERYVKRWYKTLTERIADLATSLEAPVRAVIRQIRSHLENVTSHPLLKSTASEALETKWRRIGMAQDKLRADLKTSLRATFVHYTTETHVMCPIALAMRPVYHSVLDVVGGPGAYRRHCGHLYKCLVDPPPPMTHFPYYMATEIADTQREIWMQCCREYVVEVMSLLDGFRQISDELLHRQGHVEADHQKICDELQIMLPAFEDSLVEIQKACPRLEDSEGRFSNKRKRNDE